MHSPRLTELPDPLAGKKGWPWTKESVQLTDMMADGRRWPTITVVTPSFNHGRFIEETIRSVLLQGYPNLEYFVLDGASTDNSVEIIKKYSPWLTHWISKPDTGQSEVVNRGLKMGSGLFATWINSDDMLYKNALAEHASRVGFNQNMVYLGTCAYMDEDGRIVSMHQGRVQTIEDLVRIPNIWRSGGNIVQPEVLFPRELALRVGGLNADNHSTMDYELWGKFLLAGATFQYTNIPFGMFRRHHGQKTMDGIRTTQSLIDTAINLVSLADCFSAETRAAILADLHGYLREYPKQHWSQTGKLARMGLPPGIVTPVRHLRRKIKNRVKGLSRAISEAR